MNYRNLVIHTEVSSYPDGRTTTRFHVWDADRNSEPPVGTFATQAEAAKFITQDKIKCYEAYIAECDARNARENAKWLASV